MSGMPTSPVFSNYKTIIAIINQQFINSTTSMHTDYIIQHTLTL